MEQMIVVKRRCVCGEWDKIVLIKGKAAHIPFYYVKCPGCGRQTLKHTEPDEAILEWNYMEERKNGESD